MLDLSPSHPFQSIIPTCTMQQGFYLVFFYCCWFDFIRILRRCVIEQIHFSMQAFILCFINYVRSMSLHSNPEAIWVFNLEQQADNSNKYY